MRILLVVNTLPPRDISGAGEQVLQLAAGLRESGHEVEVLGRGAPGSRIPKVLFALTVVPATWRALRRFRPDVVQVHESDAALAALLVVLVRRWLDPRPRLTALLQVSYREEMRAVRPLRFAGRVLGRPSRVERRFLLFKGPLQVVLGRLTARLAEINLAPSRRTAGEIERDYGVRDVGVLYNVTGGLRDPAEEPIGDDGGTLSENPAAPDGGEHDEDPAAELLYVGRLRIRKGVEVLLEALAALRREHPAARLAIAGAGEQAPALRAKTFELGLAERVRFLGRCDAARVGRLLAAAPCLVVPSIYEGMPLVVLEAMAAATPVVASAVSGIPEVVLDGETGWLVPPEDPPRLAAALAEVLADPAGARRRGEAGRRRLEAEFTPRRAAEQWLERLAERGVDVV